MRKRDASMIVLDHGHETGEKAPAGTTDGDAYHAQFRVPDELVW